MGLDTTHNAWHGPYSSFGLWRSKIAELANYPPLELMEGFYANGDPYMDRFYLLEEEHPKGDELAMNNLRRYKKQFPIKWDNFKDDPLITLLSHSDCDGEILYTECQDIANRLKELLPKFGTDADNLFLMGKTQQFIDGLELAFSKQENLEFH